MIYFDTSYIFRLYFQDPGWEAVRALAATDHLGCALHGRAEAIATFHRKFREGALQKPVFSTLLKEFERDCEAGAVKWLPLSSTVLDHVNRAYSMLPATVHLRAADALHLACALENNFTKIYSNDARLIASASHFGLIGENVI